MIFIWSQILIYFSDFFVGCNVNTFFFFCAIMNKLFILFILYFLIIAIFFQSFSKWPRFLYYFVMIYNQSVKIIFTSFFLPEHQEKFFETNLPKQVDVSAAIASQKHPFFSPMDLSNYSTCLSSLSLACANLNEKKWNNLFWNFYNCQNF